MKDVKIYRTHAFARIPSKGHVSDAGFDISACEHISIPSKQWKAVNTGLQFEIPEDWELQIRPRSGLALNKGITILNAPATIDSGYRGEVFVILHNVGEYPFEVHPGDRIAQIILAPVEKVKFIEVEDSFDHNTDRGLSKFGSTGTNG